MTPRLPKVPRLRLPDNKWTRVATRGVAGLLSVAVIAALVGFIGASRPGFLGAYHDFEREYETLQESAHSELHCRQCHQDSRGPLVHEAALVGDFYRGLYNKPDSPVFVKIRRPSRTACLACHLEDWSDDASRTARIPHPAHLRVAEETRECVECHKWTAHEEEYIERHKEMPFSSVCASFDCHVGTKKAEECLQCHHAVQEEKAEWVVEHPETVQVTGPNGCLEVCHEADQCRMCHTTGKRPDFRFEALSSGVKAIEREHVKPDWMAKHGQPALEDDSKCFVCHVSTGECESCHSQRPAFHGLESTWLNRHADLSKGKDERRCLACHEKPWCEECHEQFKVR